MNEQMEMDCVTFDKQIEELLDKVAKLEKRVNWLEKKGSKLNSSTQNHTCATPPNWNGTSPYVMLFQKKDEKWEMKLRVPKSIMGKNYKSIPNCEYTGGNLIQFKETGKMKFRLCSKTLYETTKEGEKVQEFCRDFDCKRVFKYVNYIETAGFLMLDEIIKSEE